MDDVDKYPFLSGEDELTAEAIIELLEDANITDDERDNYVLSILPEGAHSSYKKWKESHETYDYTEYSDDDKEKVEPEDDEASLFIYSLVDVETAPLIIEVFKNDDMTETERLEVIKAIIDEGAFDKLHNWTQRDTFKDRFLSELTHALRSMIEKKLINEDFKNVETLLKAATQKARDNYGKWRASATGINIPAPISFQNANRFPDELNVVVLSGHSHSVDYFLSFLARMLVFRPHESVKYRQIKGVEWLTSKLTLYSLRCKIEDVEKIVRLFFVPIGFSSSEALFPKTMSEIHGLLEYAEGCPYHARDDELPETLQKYFEGTPEVKSFICREDDSALEKYDDDEEGGFKRLRMKEYYNSIKVGVLNGVESSPQIEKGLSVLSKQVKQLFRSIAANTPIRLKEGNFFEKNEYNRDPYCEFSFKTSRPFTFMEEDDNSI